MKQMVNVMNKEIIDKNSFLLNDRMWLDNLIVMERYRLGYLYLKQYLYFRWVMMYFLYLFIFLCKWVMLMLMVWFSIQIFFCYILVRIFLCENMWFLFCNNSNRILNFFFVREIFILFMLIFFLVMLIKSFLYCNCFCVFFFCVGLVC